MLKSICSDPGSRRPGRGLVEVIVVAGILGFVAVLVLMALPRGRETARMAGCQKNLMHIGVGLQMYHQSSRHYPTVPTLGGPVGDGPVKAMLDAFVIPDLLDLKDLAKPPKPSQSSPKGMRVPGLACPSDPNAMANSTIPVISYRANTGDDPSGLGGPFQPGRTMTSAQIEAADGLSYTAAFAERLTGDRRDRDPSLENYVSSPGTVTSNGCPGAPADRWRGDAGSDWAEASWRSTLYNHVLTPNGAPSCIAEDGRTALMGASSGHVNRVNVLMMDSSLRVVTPSIDPRIWQGIGTVRAPGP
jgi:type II secretory pathway pseudopilin PulG